MHRRAFLTTIAGAAVTPAPATLRCTGGVITIGGKALTKLDYGASITLRVSTSQLRWFATQGRQLGKSARLAEIQAVRDIFSA